MTYTIRNHGVACQEAISQAGRNHIPSYMSTCMWGLRWLGPEAAADAQVVSILSRHLPDAVKRDLYQNSRHLPGWALPLARSITADQAVAV